MISEYTNEEPTLGFIIVSISKVKLCFDLRYINAIINPLEFSSKNIINFMEGSFVNIKDNIYPIINFNSFFNLKSCSMTSQTRMLFLEFHNIQFAFYTDMINEIIAINSASLDEIKLSEYDGDNDYIKSILNYRNNYYICPNLNKIILELKSIPPVLLDK